jgi:hypothetical protein
VKKKEKTTLITLRKHWGETQINLTFNFISFEILNNTDTILPFKYHLTQCLSPTYVLQCTHGREPKKKKNTENPFSQKLFKVFYLKPLHVVFVSMSPTLHRIAELLFGLDGQDGCPDTDKWELDLRQVTTPFWGPREESPPQAPPTCPI